MLLPTLTCYITAGPSNQASSLATVTVRAVHAFQTKHTKAAARGRNSTWQKNLYQSQVNTTTCLNNANIEEMQQGLLAKTGYLTKSGRRTTHIEAHAFASTSGTLSQRQALPQVVCKLLGQAAEGRGGQGLHGAGHTLAGTS